MNARRPATLPRQPLGLGIDAGGTQARWALAQADGSVVAEGAVPGFSGPHLATAAGRRHALAAVVALRQAVAAAGYGPPDALWAGITGHDDDAGPGMARFLASGLDVPQAVRVFNDVELAARLCFAPGGGYLVYAGTGSIAWFIDADRQAFHVGGKGSLLGDEGSGYWVAREALALLWRREDEAPGAMADTALAKHVFAAVGGARWDDTRQAVHRLGRGELGTLALAVAAAAAEGDTDALALFRQAGVELARLASLLLKRFGPRPVAVAGRAVGLHPALFASMQAALPGGTPLQALVLAVHRDAAVAAARSVAGQTQVIA